MFKEKYLPYIKWSLFNRLQHKQFFFSRRLYILGSALSIIILLLISCQSNHKETLPFTISPEERVWLTQFFEDIMFYETGIYTLWGSNKPLTMIGVEQFSDEEKQAFYDSLTEEEKNSCVIWLDYSLDKTWFQWEKIQNRFPMNRYILVKMDQLQNDHGFFILFVDILKTAATLQDNYDTFRNALGIDFHPLEITLNMREKDSIFWEKIKGNAHLWGILFGFGKMNSYLYQWQHFDHPDSCDEFCKNIVNSVSEVLVDKRIKYTIDNFSIPAFKSFNEIDPIVTHFREERNRIKEIYKEKDFLELTLKKLTE